MSLKEALEITVNTLSNINVPVAFMNQIGTPIAVAIANLNACLNGLKEAETANAENDQNETIGQ